MQPLSKNLLLKNHPDLSFNMRAKLINWLFEVTLHFKLQRETMYSTQMILDQFLTNCKFFNLLKIFYDKSLKFSRIENVKNRKKKYVHFLSSRKC